MKNKLKFYIKIDNITLQNKELNSNDKIIYSLLINLTLAKDFCWATNEKISEMSGISKRTVQNSINNLIRLNYITKWKKKKGTVVYRYITINTIEEKINEIENIKDKQKEINEIDIDYDWLNEL